MKRKNESQKVIRIPIMVPVIIAIILGITATAFIGKELISNAAKYTASNASTTEDGNFEYEVLEDGTIEITGYLGKESFVAIPDTIDGKVVTSIGNSAFEYCANLINIEIPNGIKKIEDWAFADCINLRKIEIPESVTSIGPDAFYCCINLKNINISKNNTVFMSENGILFNKEKTEIIKYPAGKANTEYTVPEGIIAIGYSAFENSLNLQIIDIPEGVTSIGAYALSGCISLTSIKIPESMTAIGYSALSYCTNLTNIEIPKNEMEIGTYAFEESKIIKAINTENLTTYEMELPDIIKRAMDENDQLYASEGFELINSEISEDGTKFVVNIEMMKEENTAGIYVKNGKLEGLSMEVVPAGTVTYSDEGWSMSYYPPFKRNVNAILHLAEGEQITNNDGKNTYTFTKDGEFTFEYTDVNGNVKTSKVVVDWLWDCTLLVNTNIMDETSYGIIADIQPETTVSQLKTIMKLDETLTIKVRNNDNEELAETDFIGTGMQLEFIEEDEAEIRLVVRGDTNGDGKADFKDLTKINSYRLNKKPLEDKYLVASDVNDDGIVDFKDLVKINKLRLNKITEI